MLKKSITPQDVCDLFNELLKLDSQAVNDLVNSRVKCNGAVADHPFVQVQQLPGAEFPSVGIIGVINGLFGIQANGMGVFCANIDDKTNKVIGFKLTV
jgi:hypothetical protein